MDQVSPSELSKKLRNIGLSLANKLIRNGITTPHHLKKVGAKESYMRIHKSGGFCSKYHASYLYALEGAIRNCDWLEIPEYKKKEYKVFKKTLRQNNNTNL